MIIAKEIEYRGDGVALRGFYAYPDKGSNLPAILIAPTWAGRDKFACDKAIALAKKGYLGFALDVYGDAKVGSSKEENATLMNTLLEDKYALMTRLRAAYSTVKKLPKVDKSNIAAMGFCFGGKCVLDMARSNVQLKAAISFHGLLDSTIAKEQNIDAKILVLHGYNDPMVTPDQVNRFQQEMTKRKADWQLHSFGNTYHAFTNPSANDIEFGTVFNATSNKRAWKLAEDFLREAFISNYPF
ncbi:MULTISPECIES: dienelactone hydrolase family protein [unclassified Francisella]|uniref:dienelactone hydrolase family protein n=1 Tax=unclassified Francisella TaxID=2610885 RepID=UPI002E2EF056|nr:MULTISPECIES: dienelactone hydrolase family protein [unclassified Francisella]MED7819204.1 dienelactone hydrolase family protein [Francisella sp. 19S2-4]MED7829976.1 dienelactone hydrolase family protein [Francisella sp. 19S2-10]